MSKMWSDKKYVDVIVNVLLFCVAMNIFHYGQLLLPIICLILFIDNKFKFKVNNIKVFVILCLFAISFCYFSYDLGFYCVMGFCLPMAYYIGSNIKYINEENIKKIIYILSFGLATHFILNFAYDYYYYETNLGVSPFGRQSHYDIWLKYEIATTGSATNCILLIGCFSYLAIFEKNKYYKITGLVLLVLSIIYDFVIGRRTPLLLLVICIMVYFVYKLFLEVNKKKVIKNILLFLIICVCITVVICIIYKTNLFNVSSFVDKLFIVVKFRQDGFRTERIDILIRAIKQMPYHLWGGFGIMNTIGDQIHMLWLDIYDCSGIISFVLFMIYTIYVIINIKKYFAINKKNNEMNLLVGSLLLSIVIQMMLEPVMTGSSIFLICSMIILSVLEASTNDVYQS